MLFLNITIPKATCNNAESREAYSEFVMIVNSITAIGNEAGRGKSRLIEVQKQPQLLGRAGRELTQEGQANPGRQQQRAVWLMETCPLPPPERRWVRKVGRELILFALVLWHHE